MSEGERFEVLTTKKEEKVFVKVIPKSDVFNPNLDMEKGKQYPAYDDKNKHIGIVVREGDDDFELKKNKGLFKKIRLYSRRGIVGTIKTTIFGTRIVAKTGGIVLKATDKGLKATDNLISKSSSEKKEKKGFFRRIFRR